MGFYDDLAIVAHQMLTEFGQTGALRVNTTVDDEDSLNPPAASYTDHPCTFALFDYKTMQIDGSRIQKGDRIAYISPGGLTVTPGPSMKLVVKDVGIEIIAVEPLDPTSAIPVLYTAQIRGG